MTASRAVAPVLGVALVAFMAACGQRSTVWNTALADTHCHASDTIVRKLKGEPGTYVVYACDEELTYRCDAASGACVADRDPASAPVTTGESPEATPLDGTGLEGPAPRDEAPTDEATPEPTPEEPAPEQPAPEDAAPEDASPSDTPSGEPGDVPEPP